MKLPIVLILTFFPFSVALACPPNQYQVKAHSRSGYVRYDGTVVRPTFVTAYCKDYSAAYLFVKDLFQNEKPKNWPHEPENLRKWTEAEKERLIEAMENIPDALLSKNLKGIYRMDKSKAGKNPATSSEGALVLYDSAFSKSMTLDRIIAHELAHQIFRDSDLDIQDNYRKNSGWTLVSDKNLKFFWIPRKEGYVAEDGKNASDEDYANNIEYYLYEPDKLKKVTPKAYDWIKTKFGSSFSQKKGKK